MTAHYRRARHRLDKLTEDHRHSSPLHPQFVAAAINRLADDDAIFTADVGTPVIWAARYLTMNGRRRLIGSFSHGSMANGLPQGIGAQASHPGRQVVTLSGDGGIAMLLGEQITLRQQHLPPKLTYGEIKGFTLYATRTLLSGEGTQLVDLVRTNLREVEAE